ncbi:unnamed protein product [Moneuplotes crassus]|uniref:Uncharacterized protein n=1 Tax=Euplotes crassus TaxID=5936 RepID=A0AAD2D3W5_EUPCR|nr:unnamed protein product [Moneuplotes crassus]
MDTGVTWDKTLKKSLSTNSQLQFSKLMTFTTYNKENEEPVADLIRYNSLIRHKDSDVVAMYFLVDRRDKIFSYIGENKSSTISAYFPLSKEKYLINGQAALVSNGEEGLDIDQEQCSEAFQALLADNLDGYQSILDNCWEQIDEHDQKLYKKAISGEKTDIEVTTKIENDDLSKYEPQKIEAKSPHSFSMLVLFPTKIDLTIYPPPQVIADARNPQFESLMKAPKKTKRYLHTYTEEAGWMIDFLS